MNGKEKSLGQILHENGPDSHRGWSDMSHHYRNKCEAAANAVRSSVVSMEDLTSEMAEKIRGLERSVEGWKSQAETFYSERLQAIIRLEALRAITKEDVWHWQGDEYDYPESLTCHVVMTADDLRGLLRLATAKKSHASVDEIQQALRRVADSYDVSSDYVNHGTDQEKCLTTSPPPV